MNKVILLGRLTRDPEVRYASGDGNMAIARFSLAVDRKKDKDGNQTADFISCVAFGKLGEFAEKYLHRGTKILYEGRWQTGSYTDKDGKKVYTNDCVAESIEFAESKVSGTQTQSQTDANGFMNVPEGDCELPF